MARKAQVSIENNFTKGLVTEKHELQFPENACVSATNVLTDSKGRLIRRPGIDLEDGTEFASSALVAGEVYNEYHWSNASENGDASFIVQQKGSTLHFYDTSSTTNVSENKTVFTLDLTTYLADSTALSAAEQYCSFSSGKATLIVTSAAINPLAVKFDEVSNDLVVTEIDIMFRDFKGLDDELGLTERPASATVADLVTDFPKHYYNIINQGWHAVDALSQWDAARSDMPSNSDQVLLYRASDTDSFDNARVTAKTPGNSPAPRGHFILSAFNPNRYGALADEGFSVIADTPIPELIDPTVGYYQADSIYVGSYNAAEVPFLSDGLTNVASTSCYEGSLLANQMAIARNFSGTPSGGFAIFKVEINGSNDRGFMGGAGATLDIELYGSNNDFPSWANGTLLATTTITDSADESATITLTPADQTTKYKNFVIRVSRTAGSYTSPCSIGEIAFYRTVDSSSRTTSRPTYSAFYGSRIFYSGLQSEEHSNSVFFSKIIETDDDFGKCYQQNDPTSEDFADLLASDGGVVNIPEIARIVGLFPYQSSLLILATNGIWLIDGTSGNGFKANDYAVRRLSSIGCNSPKSIVDVKGVPAWFGEDGIFTIKYDANFNSYTVVSLTDESIRSFFKAIPALARNNAKGVYDTNEGVAYWLYGDGVTPDAYKNILSFRVQTGAYFPFSISYDADVDFPVIRGAVYAYDTSHVTEPGVRFFTTFDGDIAYSRFYSDKFADWAVEYSDVYKDADSTFAKFYDSEAVSGYKNHSETQRQLQPNYLFVFLQDEEDAAIVFQSIFSYTTSDSSGKWGTAQVAYAKDDNLRSVTVRRFKVRGSGRVYQFKIKSLEDRPFALLGWSTWETQNAAV